MSNFKFSDLLSPYQFKLMVGGLIVCLLVACSGTYDWRMIHSNEGGFEAMFPAKPKHAEKTIYALGKNYSMSMEFARAGDALFAVSVIKFDPVNHDPKDVDRLIDWLKEQTSKTLKVDAPIVEESDLVFTVSGNPNERLLANGMKILGTGPDNVPMNYLARWVKRIDSTGQLRIFQVSVLQSLDKKLEDKLIKQLQEEYETFYAGFHPY